MSRDAASAPFCLFLFDSTSSPEIYPLSLHDALPILHGFEQYHRRALGARADHQRVELPPPWAHVGLIARQRDALLDRKSTRLNSSHVSISYAVFCLKKKKHAGTSSMYWSILDWNSSL